MRRRKDMYKNVANGMHKMYIAELGAVICTAITLIPIIGTIIGGIGALVFGILMIIALYGVGKEVEDCRKAFILMIIGMIIGVVIGLFTDIPVIGKVLSLVANVVSFLVIYLVCTSLGKLVAEAGDGATAALGEKVWKLHFIATVCNLILQVLSWIPVIKVLVAVLAVVVAIFGIVVCCFYISFLNKGSKVLSV